MECFGPRIINRGLWPPHLPDLNLPCFCVRQWTLQLCLQACSCSWGHPFLGFPDCGNEKQGPSCFTSCVPLDLKRVDLKQGNAEYIITHFVSPSNLPCMSPYWQVLTMIIIQVQCHYTLRHNAVTQGCQALFSKCMECDSYEMSNWLRNAICDLIVL